MKLSNTILLFLLGASCFDAHATDDNRPLVIMHDNDVHCAVEGYVAFAGMRDAIIAADTAYVATVSSGDFLQGGAMGGFSKGDYIISMMNAVGFDAVTLGNHEFDYGVPRLLEMTGKLRSTVTCVNFINTDTKKYYYAPYVMKQMGKKKVAFVGAVTPSTQHTEAYSFYKPDGTPLPYDLMESQTIANIQSAVNQARAAGADYVVLLTHLGEYERGSKVYAIPVIEQTTGINAVLDGHTHSVIEQAWYKNAKGEPVLLTQTGTKFNHFGKLVIRPDGQCYSELFSDADLAEKGYSTPRTKAVLDSLKQLVDGVMNQKKAHTAFELAIKDSEGHLIVRTGETNIGNLVTDAMRKACGTQVAVINGGGIRDRVAPGDVTYKQFFDAMPYSDNVSVVKLSGEALLSLMESSCQYYPVEAGSFLQVSGLRYTFNPAATPRVQSLEVMQPDGSYAPVDKNAVYTVAAINYVINTIAEFPSMAKCEHVSDDVIGDLESLLRYCDQCGGEVPQEYANTQGRIRVVAN